MTEFIEDAVSRAKGLDALPRESRGPLHGIPISLKVSGHNISHQQVMLIMIGFRSTSSWTVWTPRLGWRATSTWRVRAMPSSSACSSSWAPSHFAGPICHRPAARSRAPTPSLERREIRGTRLVGLEGPAVAKALSSRLADQLWDLVLHTEESYNLSIIIC